MTGELSGAIANARPIVDRQGLCPSSHIEEFNIRTRMHAVNKVCMDLRSFASDNVLVYQGL